MKSLRILIVVHRDDIFSKFPDKELGFWRRASISSGDEDTSCRNAFFLIPFTQITILLINQFVLRNKKVY